MAYIATGCDPDFYYDSREFNGKQSNTFDCFFGVLEGLMRENGDTAAHERRHGEGEFMSKFISVPDLMNQTKAKFTELHPDGVVFESSRAYQYAKQNQSVDEDKQIMVRPNLDLVELQKMDPFVFPP